MLQFGFSFLIGLTTWNLRQQYSEEVLELLSLFYCLKYVCPLLFFKILFILFLAVLSLCCCARTFSSALSRGYSLVAVAAFCLWCRLLLRSTGFSRCSDFSCCSQRVPGHWLSSCGAQLPHDVCFNFITSKTFELG